MARTSPCFYIAPTAISVSPNANGSASDIAVNVVRGAKIKVYSPGVPALGYSDVSFQQWTLTGRNRRLADNTKPYSIYARLAKSNKEDGYLVFAPKVASGTEWLDKYAYVTVGGLATGTANKNSEDYWYVKLGEVSLPTNNARTVTLDTGILGTDKFNTDWNIDPDQMPLRIELSATIDAKDAGDKPYVEWDKELTLKANLLEGWANANVQRFHHFTIQRNTGDKSSDKTYNYPDEKSDSENPSSGRQMPNGSITLSHARGTGDVFNGTVSSIWTVIAWGLKANVADSTSSSSSTSGTVTANVYEKLAEKSINIMAETGEQYALEMSSSVVNYDPSSGTYNPANGIDVMVRATDQRGKVFKLTNAQLGAANLFVQYSLEDPEIWSQCDFEGDDTAVAKANIPNKVFEAQKNVNVRIAKAHYLEIYRSHIAFIRSGEDGSAYDIYLSASVLKGDSTGKLNGNDAVSVTAKVVKITGGTAVQVTDKSEAYFTISRTDDRGDLIDWPSGSFTVKTFNAFGQGVKTWNFALYVGGTFLKTVMLPVVRDGKQGADGSAATVYTIETVGNYTNNSGKLVDASTIGVTLTGDLKLYKTVGNEKTEDSKPPQCWRLTVGGENVDGTRVFDNNAGNNIVTYEYYNEYNIDSNGNSTAPGSATISVYRDSSMSELLASLVVPISLNPGAIVNVDAKLGKIESTTASMKNDMNGMQGTIETIKQGQGQISLKVQDLQNGGVDTSKPHTSSQVDFRALDGNSFYPVMIRFKDDGGVRHTVEINRPLDGTYGSSEDYMTHGNGFSFRLIFSDIANGWGTNEDGQLRIESISQRWTEPTDTPICPKIEQYNLFSFMLVWLRGGSKYDITVDCTDAYISGIWPYMMQVASYPSWVPDAVRLAPDTWTTAQVNAQGGNPYNMLRKDNGGYYADVDNEYLYRFGELAAGNTFAIVGQPRDSKVWFLATWHITSVSGSKVYVDVSTYGLLWQTQNPLGIRMNYGMLGYIKTGASYPKSTWDSQKGFGTSENVDNTAVHADWAVPRAILVIGKESSATNGVYRDRAVLEAVQSCTEGSSVSFYSNTYFDVSPLYGTDGRTNVKPDLLATGIDIKSHKIVATADNFIVRNNSGTPTFSIDEDGNIVGSGGASFNGPMKATTFTLNSTYFSVKEDGTITAKGGQAAEGIMTTDTKRKEIAVSFTVGGKVCKIGGICKGSGMIHPNMATMLVFITTDCAISPAMLQKALSTDIANTFNMVSVDGDTSTNDMVTVLANGLAGNAEITEEGADFTAFMQALNTVTVYLCRCIAGDGEGATKLLECRVSGAPTLDIAKTVAKSVICSSLTKAAMFGADANWGRVLCAIGYSGAPVDVNKIDVQFASKAGTILVCENGAGVDFSEEQAKKILLEHEIEILIDLKSGEASSTAWGCDLTYDYVKINGDYRT